MIYFKNATRIDFKNVTEFEELLSRVRDEENMMKLNQGVQHQPTPATVKGELQKSDSAMEIEDTSKMVATLNVIYHLYGKTHLLPYNKIKLEMLCQRTKPIYRFNLCKQFHYPAW